MSADLSYVHPTPNSPWGTYLSQVDRVVPYLGHLSRWVETLKRPKRALIVDVPIEMDDGSIAHFEGYRVQHNMSPRPGQGRRALPPRRDAGRSDGAVGLDDGQDRRASTCPTAAPRAASASIRSSCRRRNWSA